MNKKFEQFLELTRGAWEAYLGGLALTGRTLDEKNLYDDLEIYDLYREYKKKADGVARWLNSP